MRRLLPLLLIFGCGQTRGFQGQDHGSNVDLQDSEPANSATSTDGDSGAMAEMLDLDDAICDESSVPPTPDLIAIGGLGEIAVTHVGQDGQCCAEWVWEPTYIDGTIEITYADMAEMDCDCSCAWTLDYTITEVPSGDWTVSAGGMETSVRVQ